MFNLRRGMTLLGNTAESSDAERHLPFGPAGAAAASSMH